MNGFAISPDLLEETLVIYAKTGSSGTGAPVFSAGRTVRGYVEPGATLTINEKGQQVTCNLLVMFAGSCSLNTGDDIKWNARRYEVMSVEYCRIGGETVHIEAKCRSVAR